MNTIDYAGSYAVTKNREADRKSISTKYKMYDYNVASSRWKYDAETGEILNLDNTPAFTKIDEYGLRYESVPVNGHYAPLYASKVCWLLTHGSYPDDYVNFESNKQDLSIKNLKVGRGASPDVYKLNYTTYDMVDANIFPIIMSKLPDTLCKWDIVLVDKNKFKDYIKSIDSNNVQITYTQSGCVMRLSEYMSITFRKVPFVRAPYDDIIENIIIHDGIRAVTMFPNILKFKGITSRFYLWRFVIRLWLDTASIKHEFYDNIIIPSNPDDYKS